jgi:hypothetical protein
MRAALHMNQAELARSWARATDGARTLRRALVMENARLGVLCLVVGAACGGQETSSRLAEAGAPEDAVIDAIPGSEAGTDVGAAPGNNASLPCHDGTSAENCCRETPDTLCDGTIPSCATPCQSLAGQPPDSGLSATQGHYYCNDGRWRAGMGLFPCSYSP